MRYIIFSDLHSNLESLQAFEKEIASIRHDKLVCLGDIVGYGADPNACVDWVREHADIVLGGNHDYAAVKKTDTEYFNPWAYQSCLWTRHELTKKNARYLSSLPYEKGGRGVHWVHSSPFEPEEWHYITSSKHGPKNFAAFKSRICFFGHTHQPLILDRNPEGEIAEYNSPVWDFEKGHRYIVNVGSLGQPRDGNPDPCFVVFDKKKEVLEYRRYTYNFKATQKKILKSGLPYPLADRLAEGW